MATLHIPEQEAKTLVEVTNLPEAVFQQLSSALSDLTRPLRRKAITKLIASRMPSLSSRDADRIVRLLVSLYSVKSSVSSSTDEFIGDVSDAMRENDREELRLSTAQQDALKVRLKKLLNSEAFNAMSKAIQLQVEHERVFQNARVLTDARPIFGEKATDTPSAAVLTHMLRLSYFQSGLHKEFYVAMDGDDVAKLKSLLERAEKKGKTLQEVLKKAGIPVIQAQEAET